MNKNSYVYGLDLIRLTAALFVALFHYTWHTPALIYVPFGWVAVQIFFVISGFVIAQSAVAVSPARFLKGRILRIFPTAWIALVVNVFCLAITPRLAYTAHKLAVYLSLRKVAYSFVLFGPTFVASAYWTLPIELAFYALVFAILFFRGKPCLRSLAIGLTLLSLPYQTLLGLYQSHVLNIPWIDFHYGQFNCLLLRHGCFFALGIFLYLDSRAPLTVKTAIFPLIALILCCAEIIARSVELAVIIQSSPHLVATLGLFFVALITIKALVHLSQRTKLSDRTQRMFRTAGLVTYPFYLIHECAGGTLLYAFATLGLPFTVALVLTVLSVGALATLITLVAEPVTRRALAAVLQTDLCRSSYYRVERWLKRPVVAKNPA